MDEEAAFRNLFGYLRRTAGDTLRSVVRYDDSDHQVLYGSDALSNYSAAEVESFVERHREERGEELRRERRYDVGALHSTVRLYEEAVIIHLCGNDGVGVVVSLYPEAASALSTFVRGCHEQLADCPAFDGVGADGGGPDGNGTDGAAGPQ